MDKDQLQLGFVEDNEIWKEEWIGMPEYEQEKLDPQTTIFIHFRSEEDARDFEKVIGQKIYPKEKSYWHPVRVPQKPNDYRYMEEIDD